MVDRFASGLESRLMRGCTFSNAVVIKLTAYVKKEKEKEKNSALQYLSLSHAMQLIDIDKMIDGSGVPWAMAKFES